MVRFSIVIPAFNGERFIPRALASVCEQSYPPHEIIVVDDGSTDQTADIVQRFPAPVRLIRQPNGGVAAARNTGIQQATGDWIALLDQDDLFLPDKLKRQAELIESNPRLVLVYSGLRVRHEDGTSTDCLAHSPSKLWPTLRYRSLFMPSTAVIRRSALQEVGGFDARLRMSDDWDLWIRLLRQYSPAAFAAVSEPQAVRVMWSGNHSREALKLLSEIERVTECAVADLRGWRQRLWRRRILSRAYFECGIELRARPRENYRDLLLRSFALWPWFGRVVPFWRYKALLLMLCAHRQTEGR